MREPPTFYIYPGATMRLDKAADKISKVMSEFKDKSLHTGGDGKIVKSRKQAIAIALSEAAKIKGKK